VIIGTTTFGQTPVFHLMTDPILVRGRESRAAQSADERVARARRQTEPPRGHVPDTATASTTRPRHAPPSAQQSSYACGKPSHGGVFSLTGAFSAAPSLQPSAKVWSSEVVTRWTVLAASWPAFIWNMTTWWFGLPSSSSHALIGGLCGAAFRDRARELVGH